MAVVPGSTAFVAGGHIDICTEAAICRAMYAASIETRFPALAAVAYRFTFCCSLRVLGGFHSLCADWLLGVGSALIAPPVPNEENHGTEIVGRAYKWLKQVSSPDELQPLERTQYSHCHQPCFRDCRATYSRWETS